MSTEANKDLVRRLWYEQFWDKWNTDIADDLFSPNYVLHMAGIPEPVDRDGIKQLVRAFGAAFHFTHAVEEMAAEGNTARKRPATISVCRSASA